MLELCFLGFSLYMNFFHTIFPSTNCFGTSPPPHRHNFSNGLSLFSSSDSNDDLGNLEGNCLTLFCKLFVLH